MVGIECFSDRRLTERGGHVQQVVVRRASAKVQVRELKYVFLKYNKVGSHLNVVLGI